MGPHFGGNVGRFVDDHFLLTTYYLRELGEFWGRFFFASPCL